MSKDWSNYMFKKKENETLIKYPGDLNGNAFVIDTLNNCDVYILDYTAQIQVDDCVNCRIFIGPCDGSVFFRDCKDCYVNVACRQLRTRDCENISFATYCATDPSIESSRGLLFSCWRGAYPNLTAHFTSAKLNPLKNTWDKIHDFNSLDPDVLEHGSSVHYNLDYSFQGWWCAPVEGEPECPVPFRSREGEDIHYPNFPEGFEVPSYGENHSYGEDQSYGDQYPPPPYSEEPVADVTEGKAEVLDSTHPSEAPPFSLVLPAAAVPLTSAAGVVRGDEEMELEDEDEAAAVEEEKVEAVEKEKVEAVEEEKVEVVEEEKVEVVEEEKVEVVEEEKVEVVEEEKVEVVEEEKVEAVEEEKVEAVEEEKVVEDNQVEEDNKTVEDSKVVEDETTKEEKEGDQATTELDEEVKEEVVAVQPLPEFTLPPSYDILQAAASGEDPGSLAPFAIPSVAIAVVDDYSLVGNPFLSFPEAVAAPSNTLASAVTDAPPYPDFFSTFPTAAAVDAPVVDAPVVDTLFPIAALVPEASTEETSKASEIDMVATIANEGEKASETSALGFLLLSEPAPSVSSPNPPLSPPSSLPLFSNLPSSPLPPFPTLPSSPPPASPPAPLPQTTSSPTIPSATTSLAMDFFTPPPSPPPPPPASLSSPSPLLPQDPPFLAPHTPPALPSPTVVSSPVPQTITNSSRTPVVPVVEADLDPKTAWRRAQAERLKLQDLDEKQTKERVRAAAKAFLADKARERLEKIKKKHAENQVEERKTVADLQKDINTKAVTATVGATVGVGVISSAASTFGMIDWNLTSKLCQGSKPLSIKAGNPSTPIAKDTSGMLKVFQQLKTQSSK